MLSREEWVSFDLTGLAELAKSGQISRREILLTALREIEALNPSLNAVVVADFDAALETIVEGRDAARFSGLPYVLKDLHAPAKDLPLANGSVRLKGTQFDFDSTTVARLRAAGLRFLGRTASPELGLSLATESAAWGITRNPWNTDHGAGGSSGGSGAAVASGMLPAAHATDSGGSIRIPSSFNGVVGFKPTRGLNAIGPHRGDLNFGISHEHAITRTVRDTAALLDITAGPDAGCPYFTPKPETAFEDLITGPLRSLKIGIALTQFNGKAIHPEAVKAVQSAAAHLETLGHHVDEAMPAFDVDLLADVMFKLLFGTLAGLVPPDVGTSDEDLAGFEPITRASIRFALGTSLREHLQRAAVMNQQIRTMAGFSKHSTF